MKKQTMDIQDSVQELLGKQEYNLYSTSRQIAFLSFLTEIRFKPNISQDNVQRPQYPRRIKRDIQNLEHTFSEYMQAIRYLSSAPHTSAGAETYRNLLERLTETSNELVQYRLQFVRDSNIDVVVERNHLVPFKIEQILPRIVVVCENPSFATKPIFNNATYDDSIDLLLPAYDRVGAMSFPGEEIPYTARFAKIRDGLFDKTNVKLLQRKDLCGNPRF